MERSFSEVLHDITANLQTIIRSEVRLAKTEVREEVHQAGPAIAVIAAAGLAGIFAVLFVLFAALYGLSNIMPDWAAALLIAGCLAILTWAGINAGLKRFRQITPGLPKTMNNLKENVEWTKQQMK